jgi:hypothetical protein
MKKIPAALAPTMKKKEKKQSTLFPSTGVGGVKQQHQQEHKIAPNASSQLLDIENQNNKRKLRTSTVTPPGGGTDQQNCSLVFRLKHGGKYISPEARQTAATAAATSTTTIANESKKKAELSEDELGDFSDDDGDNIDNSFTAVATSASFGKKLLEKFLHKKRRMDSIESTDSVDNTKSKSQLSSTVENVPSGANSPITSKSTSTQEEKKQRVIPNNNSSKNKDRKFKQTFLFGRTPPNHDTSDEMINLPEPADVVNMDATLNNDHPSERAEGGGEIIRQCQSVTESKENGVTVNTATNAALKGKQRSITSWFQPR